MPGVLDPPPKITPGRDRLSVDGDNDVSAGQHDLAAHQDAARSWLDTGLLRATRHLLHQEPALIGRDAQLLLDLRAQDTQGESPRHPARGGDNARSGSARAQRA